MPAELLTILALERQCPMRRTVLVERLWGDVSWKVGRRRLNTTLHRLRTDLSEFQLDTVLVATTSNDRVVLDQRWVCDVDVDRLGRAASRATWLTPLSSTDLVELEAAAGLYRPNICAGAEGSWILAVRARLENEALAIRTRLANHFLDQDQFPAALHHATAALTIDHLREDLHRLVIRCHLAKGDRASAIRHFEELKAILADQLDVGPMPETINLITASAGGVVPPVLDLDSLRLALEQSRAQLQGLLTSVEVALEAIDANTVAGPTRG